MKETRLESGRLARLKLAVWLVMAAAVMWMPLRLSGQVAVVGPTVVGANYLTNFVYDAVTAADGRSYGSLLFDGTANQYGRVTMTGSQSGSGNIGNKDFTWFLRVFVPVDWVALTEGYGDLSSSAGPAVAATMIQLYHQTDGALVVALRGQSSGDARAGTLTNFMQEFTGRWVSLALVRATVAGVSTNMTLYVNGTPRTMTETTAGTAPGWNGDIINTYGHMGVASTASASYRGRINRFGLVNYAMSAAEIRDLTVAEVKVSNRAGKFREKILNVSRNGALTQSGSDWAVSGGATVVFDAANDEVDVTNVPTGDEGTMLGGGFIGQVRTSVVHRVEFELRNVSGGTVSVIWGSETVATGLSANGRYWYEAAPGAHSGNLEFQAGAGTVFSVANVSIYDLGLNGGVPAANGSFETAGGGGADVFANWTESNTASVWSRDTSGSHGRSGTAAAKLVVDGAGTAATLTTQAGLVMNRRYRARWWSKVDSVSGSPTLLVSAGTGYNVFTNSPSVTLTQYSVDFVSNGTALTFQNGSGSAGRTYYIDDVRVEELGTPMEIDCGPGVGYQAFDRSGNNYHALLLGGVGHEREAVARTGVVRGRTSTSGNEQLLGGVCLPVNARIRMIVVNASGSATVSVGTASGGTQIVNGASVVSGRNEPTIVGRYTSSGEIWVNASAGVKLDWTISYELQD